LTSLSGSHTESILRNYAHFQIADRLGTDLFFDLTCYLQPGVEDGYEWKLLPGKEDLLNEDLFTKQLSKHSIGAYMELCRGVEVSFEATVIVLCQLCA
jgi:hypothetical protein